MKLIQIYDVTDVGHLAAKVATWGAEGESEGVARASSTRLFGQITGKEVRWNGFRSLQQNSRPGSTTFFVLWEQI